MKSFAYDIYRYMPTNYFKYSQAPLMKIDYPYTVYAGLQFLIESSLDQFQYPIYTEISNNLITDNLNIQVVTYEALKYKSSLLEFTCDIQNATLAMNNNEVTRNQFIGEDTTFFYIDGGVVLVADNNFSYNGMLTNKE